MKKILAFVIVVLIVASILTYLSPKSTTNNSSTSRSSSPADPQAVETIAQNLEIPWALDFLPSGEIIFTQRSGALSILRDGKVKKIADIPSVLHSGEGGLLGVTTHPNFDQNSYIYLYFTYQASGNDTKNKLVRYRLKNDSLSEEKSLIENIPGALFHNGGRLKFGPDNFLYITTGDSQDPSLSQNKNSLAGKILRITDEGKAAPGNPFNTMIYSYGHRNPQGLSWQDDRLYSTEHGSSTHDEVNLIVKGGNFGWPEIEGDETRSGMIPPLAQSGNETWAPSGLSYLNGSLYFGGLRGTALFELRLEGSTAIITKHFAGEFGRIRDAVLGPDGLIYVTTSNRDGRGSVNSGDDKIIRIDPSKL